MMDAQNQSGRWFNGHDGRASLLSNVMVQTASLLVNVGVQTGENLSKLDIQTVGKVRTKCP
jgi:hypothetical protein